MNIDTAVKFANKTGNCPVCRVAKSGHGITCGSWGCMNLWLPGGDKSLLPGAPRPLGSSTRTSDMFKSGGRLNTTAGYEHG